MKAILVLLLLASSAMAQTAELASVRVYCFHQEAKRLGVPDGFGSGIYVSENQILTNFHVVEKRKKILADPMEAFITGEVSEDREHPESLMVRFTDGHRCWATVEAEDSETDVALLRITPHKTIKPVPMATQNAAWGSVVRLHGFGYDYEYKMIRSVIGDSMIRGEMTEEQAKIYDRYSVPDPNGPWVVLTFGQAIPGDSGGPFMQNGKLVGLVHSTGDGYSQGVHIESIRTTFTGRLK